MNWVEPKTNWLATDFFNIEDYNRIINNMECLKEMSFKLYKKYNTHDMGEEKDYASMIYASEFNKIEENLETINDKTLNFNIGDTKNYVANGNTPDYTELNRIELGMKSLYETIMYSSKAMATLDFVLGGQKGIKV